MERYDLIKSHLQDSARTWTVTGAAGFIGFHLVETLLDLGQRVVGVDNFETGDRDKIASLTMNLHRSHGRFEFIEGDICDSEICERATAGSDYVLHEAALISVAESMSDPHRYNEVNVTGFLNLLVAASRTRVKKVVLASSCAVYGDTEPITKTEGMALEPISPYGLTKALDEQYAALFNRAFGVGVVGLRYFNAYGPGQKVGGAYGAVIPRWIEAALQGQPCSIFGDGLTTRDYCNVRDIVQANILAAHTPLGPGEPIIFNIGSGERVSLRRLHDVIQRQVGLRRRAGDKLPAPVYAEARAGDIRHVGADISLAYKHLGYKPRYTLERGLLETIEWRARTLDQDQPGVAVAR